MNHSVKNKFKQRMPQLKNLLRFIEEAPQNKTTFHFFSNPKIKVLRQGTISSENNSHVRAHCSTRGWSLAALIITEGWRWDFHLNLWPTHAIICPKETSNPLGSKLSAWARFWSLRSTRCAQMKVLIQTVRVYDALPMCHGVVKSKMPLKFERL